MVRKLLYLVAGFSFIGCEGGNEVSAELDYGYDYYPLEIGTFTVYDSEQTLYSFSGEVTTTFQYKSIIADAFENEGNTTYVLNNYKRSTADDAWKIDKVYSAAIVENELVIQKENKSFAVLKFPVKNGSVWDGNRFNTMEEDIYTLQDVGETFEWGDTAIPETATVEQNNNLDELVETDYRVQVFAKGIGLIYNEVKQIYYCTEADCFGLGQIEEGIWLKQTIIDYGKE